MTARIYYPAFPRRAPKPPVEVPESGRPLTFRCIECYRDYREVRLTGRTCDMGWSPGERRLDRIARQYRCACGHVGWSQCPDLKFARV